MDLPDPKGPSRLAPAIDAALAHLSAQPGPERAQVLVLVGGADDDKAVRASLARAERLGIPVTFGEPTS